MAGSPLKIYEAPLGQRRQIDCVEIYLPKSLAFLPELYQLLRDKINNRFGSITLDGFSTYEVDGVFRGEQTWEQRTLIIRLLLVRPGTHRAAPVELTIHHLGIEIATKVATNEEQIWICHYPQTLTVFYGLKRILK
jgi:hypothetical protein